MRSGLRPRMEDGDCTRMRTNCSISDVSLSLMIDVSCSLNSLAIGYLKATRFYFGL